MTEVINTSSKQTIDDNWDEKNSAHRDLRHQWTGATTFKAQWANLMLVEIFAPSERVDEHHHAGHHEDGDRQHRAGDARDDGHHHLHREWGDVMRECVQCGRFCASGGGAARCGCGRAVHQQGATAEGYNQHRLRSNTPPTQPAPFHHGPLTTILSSEVQRCFPSTGFLISSTEARVDKNPGRWGGSSTRDRVEAEPPNAKAGMLPFLFRWT